MSLGNTQVSLDVDMLADLPAKAMLALVTKHRETKKYFEQAQRAIQDFPALFLKLEEMDIDLRFDPDMKYICLSFAGDGPRLGKLWGELRRSGFACEERPKKGDTSFAGWFKQEGYPQLLVNFTSTLCRRVQVGTKTVEQPIFETICGDSLEVSAPETPPALTVVGGGAVANFDDDIPF